jgi:hypothetical protein
MPRFKVPVVSEELDQARKALDGAAGVSWFGASSSRGSKQAAGSSSDRVTAILKAASAEEAERRIRELVGADSEVGPAHRMGEPIED